MLGVNSATEESSGQAPRGVFQPVGKPRLRRELSRTISHFVRNDKFGVFRLFTIPSNVLNIAEMMNNSSGLAIKFFVVPFYLSGQQQLIFLRPALSHIGDVDSGSAEHGALCFTDAASDAKLKVDAGLLDRDDPALPVAHARSLEPDRFL